MRHVAYQLSNAGNRNHAKMIHNRLSSDAEPETQMGRRP